MPVGNIVFDNPLLRELEGANGPAPAAPNYKAPARTLPVSVLSGAR